MRAIGFAVLITLAACAAPLAVPPNVQLDAAKAEYSAETAYNLAANAYESALPHLSVSQKATAKSALQTAYKALLAARKAQAVGDAATLSAQVTAIQAAYAQIKALTQ